MNKPVKTILTSNEGKPAVRFSPVVKKENLSDHLSNLLDSLPIALLNLVVLFPMMRPPIEKERQAHIYVFQEGDEGAKENKLYKARKEIYDRMAALFSAILSTGFPDIEYIEGCAKYQQEFVIDDAPEDYDAYLKEIQAVTEYVREHYEEILANETNTENKDVAK